MLLLGLLAAALTTTPLQTQSVPLRRISVPSIRRECPSSTRGRGAEGIAAGRVRAVARRHRAWRRRPVLVVVNSGYGVQFTSAGNKGQQLLQVIDLAAQPAPIVVQSVYFPSPQSVNVGVAFGRRPDRSGAWPLYASGGFENRVWRFAFSVGAAAPITPAHDSDAGSLTAPSIDLHAMAPGSANAAYNGNREPLYPTGLAISANGRDLFVANNLGDSLGIVRDERADRVRTIRSPRPCPSTAVSYPYDVRTAGRGRRREGVRLELERQLGGRHRPAIASWDWSSRRRGPPERHDCDRGWPAALRGKREQRHVSGHRHRGQIGELERIPVGLIDEKRLGNSPEALALSANERALFVANAQTQSVAVVQLSKAT